MKRKPRFMKKLNDLFFKIEKHILTGGGALSVAQCRDMLGVRSNSTAERYINALVSSGLIKRLRFRAYTITLDKSIYPPVEYRKDMMRSNDHASN